MSSQRTIWDKFKKHDFAHAYFDEFLNTYVATQIKVLRETRGLKQEQLAQLADMKQARISVLENVNYSSWSVNTLRRIAKALGVRLKISFETFSSGLPEIRAFNSQALERKSLAEELAERGDAPVVSASIEEEIFPKSPATSGLALAAAQPPEQQVNISRALLAADFSRRGQPMENRA